MTVPIRSFVINRLKYMEVIFLPAETGLARRPQDGQRPSDVRGSDGNEKGNVGA